MNKQNCRTRQVKEGYLAIGDLIRVMTKNPESSWNKKVGKVEEIVQGSDGKLMKFVGLWGGIEECSKVEVLCRECRGTIKIFEF